MEHTHIGLYLIHQFIYINIMKKVEVICPLYNSLSYIDNLVKSILEQKEIDIIKINFIITDTNDHVEDHLIGDDRITFSKIKKEDFSHSIVREQAIFGSNADIAILITDDVKIIDEYAFSKLVSSFDIDNKIAIAFGRQICTNNSIEKYTRILNYPLESKITTFEDIEKEQIKAFFFSDAFSAYDVKIFKELNGYDNKNLPTNEDMYYARKVLLNGYKKYYNHEAFVNHSHNYKLKELYKRYYLYGEFFKVENEFKNYHATDSGFKLAINVFKLALKDFNIKALFMLFPNMLVRLLGKRKGEKE